MIIKILNSDKEYDLTIPIESLKYLIYATGDLNRFLQLSLHHAKYESTSLYKYSKDIQEAFENEENSYLAIHYAGCFEELFIDNEENFIFQDFFYQNNETGDSVKTALLNRFITNIDKIILEISKTTGEVIPFVEDGYPNYPELFFKLSEGFSIRQMIYPDYELDNPVKIDAYPFRLLSYCFGVALNRVRKKLKTDFSSFLSSTQEKQHELQASTSFPDFFKSESAYLTFKKYAAHHFDNLYKSYGYVFQRMLDDNMIHRIKHIDFADFLKNENYINIDVYNEIIEKNQFDSLQKSKSTRREKVYNQAFYK